MTGILSLIDRVCFGDRLFIHEVCRCSVHRQQEWDGHGIGGRGGGNSQVPQQNLRPFKGCWADLVQACI